MPVLTIQLLGPPVASVDGRAIQVDTRKAIALLAYLAVEPRPHARESLAVLLWPEYDQARAHGALRRTLSVLRKAVGGGFVEADRSSVVLGTRDVDVDVERFRASAAGCGRSGPHSPCSACRQRLAEAAVTYRARFLSGFALRDSVEFDDWQFATGEEIARELAGVLQKLADEHLAAGDQAKALETVRRWVALDQLQEPAHRAVMALSAAGGDRAGALRQYRECVAVLDRELGVSPVAETTELYHAIREGRDLPHAIPAAKPPAAARPPGPDVLPLVGRSDVLESLHRTLDAAPDGRVVVVEGEAGVGKTRLASELANSLRERGLKVATARCHEGESSLAFGPIVHLLRGLGLPGGIPDHALGEVSRLLPELSTGVPPVLDSAGAQTRFFDGVAETLALRLAANGSPGVIVLDDLQWADPATVDLVTYIVRRLDSRPLHVVLTWRSEEVPHGDRRRRMLSEAAAETRGLGVVLDRLSKDDVAELGRLRGVSDPEELDRLYRDSEGLPLVLAEQLGGHEGPGGGRGIADLVAGRLERASETARQVLTAGATIGRSFDADTARSASGRSEDETVDALEELLSLGFLLEASGTYDFRHERVRDAVYAQTTLARRRLLHGRVAEALVGRRPGPAGTPHAVIAFHFAHAGRETEAARHSEAAARRARSLFANQDALKHLEAALAYGHPDKAGIHAEIGDLHTLLGRYAEALAGYETAAALSASAGAGLEHRLAALHMRIGDWELAERHLRMALDATERDDERARLTADLALVAHRRGDAAAALLHATAALAIAETGGDPESRAQAHNVAGILATRRGDLDEALEHLARSNTIAASLGDDGVLVSSLNNLALARSARGEHEPALESAHEALRLCAARGDRHREAALHSNIADILHAAGRSEEAKPHQLAAAALFAEVGAGPEPQPEIWKLVEW